LNRWLSMDGVGHRYHVYLPAEVALGAAARGPAGRRPAIVVSRRPISPWPRSTAPSRRKPRLSESERFAALVPVCCLPDFRNPMTSYILGLSAYYHDSAACLLRDGEIVAAAQEERFTRKKGDPAFPREAVGYCLRTGGIGVGDLSHVGFYDKPLLKFERILETYLGIAPRGIRSFLMAGPLWIKEKLYLDRELRAELDYTGDIFYAEHHESHAASAFFPSPFERAAILTMDGVGEWATASIGIGEGNDIRLVSELHWPDSLGLLYSAITYYLGFKVNSGEYKVMGLAPYGEPKYVKLLLDHVVNLREDGSLILNQK
jgi:carbamoyltransferase